VASFRLGSKNGATARNCVAVVDDPNGDRGEYIYNTSKNGRAFWVRNCDATLENCVAVVKSEDVQPGSAFEVDGNSSISNCGGNATMHLLDCHVNSDAPVKTRAQDGGRIDEQGLDNRVSVDVIGGGGVPTSARMAADGGREMPPAVPGDTGGSPAPGSGDGSSGGYDHHLVINGPDGRTDYSFTVSTGELVEDTAYGTVGDSVSGNTATGFVNGGKDVFNFNGSIIKATSNGDATWTLDGTEVNPATLGVGDMPTDSVGGVIQWVENHPVAAGTALYFAYKVGSGAL